VTPPRFQHATVIARGEQGKDYVLVTFSEWMMALCERYERKSSTEEKQPPMVELSWTVDRKIVDLTEAA